MINFLHSKSLIDSKPYHYYKEAIKSKLRYYLSINSGFQGNALVQAIDEDSSQVIWAEENGIIVGCVTFHLSKIGKKIFTINLTHADSNVIRDQLNEYVEKYAADLGCYFIEELITVSDGRRIHELESMGYQKEFTLMFKKV